MSDTNTLPPRRAGCFSALRDRLSRARLALGVALRALILADLPDRVLVRPADATLVSAMGDLGRLDAEIATLLRGDERDAHEVPGYQALEDARSDVLAVLIGERARALSGLQAKARALLTLKHDPDTTEDLGRSLARDLLGADDRAIEPQPDPIFAALAESRRLDAITDATFAEWPRDMVEPPEVTEQREATFDAFMKHWREVALKTTPTTASGCAALCRYVVEYLDRERIDLNEGPEGVKHDVLRLVAQSPLL